MNAAKQPIFEHPIGLRNYQIRFVPGRLALGAGYHVDLGKALIYVSLTAPVAALVKAIIVAREHEPFPVELARLPLISMGA